MPCQALVLEKFSLYHQLYELQRNIKRPCLTIRGRTSVIVLARLMADWRMPSTLGQLEQRTRNAVLYLWLWVINIL